MKSQLCCIVVSMVTGISETNTVLLSGTETARSSKARNRVLELQINESLWRALSRCRASNARLRHPRNSWATLPFL
jgi:hypothetical protein